ncbi:MAG: ABC transporter ATP-binding protein [Streptosporangiaceae bacterium]
MSALLELEGVTGGYGSVTIVSDVSLSLREGETLALLGRNGMGKTTLLRAIFGLADRHTGSVRVDGEELPPRHPELLARRGLTLVPDDRGVFPRLTVEENLELARLIARRRGAAVPSKQALGPFPELERRRGQPAGELSGGLQQQLAIARALGAGARLVAVDELSQGIQPSIVEALVSVLERITRELGVALVLVDQSPPLALRLCERAVILNKGAIAVDSTSAEIAARGEDYMDLLVV